MENFTDIQKLKEIITMETFLFENKVENGKWLPLFLMIK